MDFDYSTPSNEFVVIHHSNEFTNHFSISIFILSNLILTVFDMVSFDYLEIPISKAIAIL